MKQSVSVLFIIMLGASVLRAQVVLPERKGEIGPRENVFGLGVAVGPATGVGLSFRHHLPTALSYQVTGGIIKVNERVYSAIGVDVQYDLVRSALTRFFAGGGAGYYYSGRSSGNELEAPARLGMGIGGEYNLAPGVHATAELLFTYFTDGTILPLPQLGCHYYFY